MSTYLFPGQGSQLKGMGRTLFDEFPDLTDQADDVLGYSIKRLCLDDPYAYLSRTQYTQPALYVVNALSYLSKIAETGKKPDFVAGHSLGEYNALFAAGAFDFKTGLELVQKRGEFMSAVSGGAMAAVIGLKAEQVEEVLERNQLSSVDVANYNTDTQIVISGRKEDIKKAQPIFETNGSVQKFVLLNVSGAFHSRYMREVGEAFKMFLQSYTFQPLSIPVISNVNAKPYKHERIAQGLSEQISSAVKWSESIYYLLEQGETDFEEIGPGGVLTGMLFKIRRDRETAGL
ncbi:Polyketide biosynthesis malonyl CoA-acyl carrier protein transacylase PksC [compost metagenome]